MAIGKGHRIQTASPPLALRGRHQTLKRHVWQQKKKRYLKFGSTLNVRRITRYLCSSVLQLGNLSPTLYLQRDNCWKEKKKRFVLCFLALLVKLGIFKKVRRLAFSIVICKWILSVNSRISCRISSLYVMCRSHYICSCDCNWNT